MRPAVRYGLWVLTMLVAGCRAREGLRPADSDLSHYIELSQAAEPTPLQIAELDETHLTRPLPVDPKHVEYWDLSPEEAIQITLTNSQVLRELGGSVLRSPQFVRTIHSPVIQQTDPQFGIDAALSAFDAQVATSALHEKRDRAVNNRFLAGSGNILQQDLFAYNVELSKRSATGGQFAARKQIEYDASNATGNLFPSAWTTILEGEIRQPLLQGAGQAFNRIAGPVDTPGTLNGVVIARINADASSAEFEIGLRDLINNVENAYWDLYYAYRDLDAKITARDAALHTWQRIQAQSDLPGGVAEKEAQAREQYYRFEEEVQNAQVGNLVEGTRSNNGSSGGTFRGVPGVYVAERRLRLLMGVPINDGRLIRPTRDPVVVKILFDWPTLTAEALTRRPELYRQRLQVQRREMEVVAAKNFLLPRLDLVGQYRFRGFGEDLIDPNRADRPRFDNAFGDLTTGDFQEWQMGAELSFPVGFRRAHSAVYNAQLMLARERALLREQEREVLLGITNAVADLDRVYAEFAAAYNRRAAAQENRQILQERENLGARIDLNLLLDAQRREADADIRYFQAMAEYAVAIKNIHFEKGTLLAYHSIFLAEQVHAPVAAPGASQILPTTSRPLNYAIERPSSEPAPSLNDPPSSALPVHVEDSEPPPSAGPQQVEPAVMQPDAAAAVLPREYGAPAVSPAAHLDVVPDTPAVERLPPIGM